MIVTFQDTMACSVNNNAGFKSWIMNIFFLLYNNRNLTTRTMGKQYPENFISEYFMYIHNFIDKLKLYAAIF